MDPKDCHIGMLVRIKPNNSAKKTEGKGRHYMRGKYMGTKQGKAIIHIFRHKKEELIPFDEIKLWKSKSKIEDNEYVIINEHVCTFYNGLVQKAHFEQFEDHYSRAKLYPEISSANRARGMLQKKWDNKLLVMELQEAIEYVARRKGEQPQEKDAELPDGATIESLTEEAIKLNKRLVEDTQLMQEAMESIKRTKEMLKKVNDQVQTLAKKEIENAKNARI